MEARKKSVLVRASLLAVAAVSMLLTGLIVASSATTAGATDKHPCPEGFSLTDDGKACYQQAQTQTTTLPPACASGSLTPDGSACYVKATVTPQSVEVCPSGYTGPTNGSCSRTVAGSESVAAISTPNAATPGVVTPGIPATPATCSIPGASVANCASANAPVQGVVTPGIPATPATCSIPGASVANCASANAPIQGVVTPGTSATCSIPGASVAACVQAVPPTQGVVTPAIPATCSIPGASVANCTQAVPPTQGVVSTEILPCPAGYILETTTGGGQACKPNDGTFTTQAQCSSTQVNIGDHADGTSKCVSTVPQPSQQVCSIPGASVASCQSANAPIQGVVTPAVPATCSIPGASVASCQSANAPVEGVVTPATPATCSIPGASVAACSQAVPPTQGVVTPGTPAVPATCSIAGASVANCATPNPPTISCPDASYTLSGSTCTRPTTSTETVKATTKALDPLISCSAGSLASAKGNNVCILGPSTTDSVTEHVCKTGVLDDKMGVCVIGLASASTAPIGFTG